VSESWCHATVSLKTAQTVSGNSAKLQPTELSGYSAFSQPEQTKVTSTVLSGVTWSWCYARKRKATSLFSKLSEASKHTSVCLHRSGLNLKEHLRKRSVLVAVGANNHVLTAALARTLSSLAYTITSGDPLLLVPFSWVLVTEDMVFCGLQSMCVSVSCCKQQRAASSSEHRTLAANHRPTIRCQHQMQSATHLRPQSLAAVQKQNPVDRRARHQNTGHCRYTTQLQVPSDNVCCSAAVAALLLLCCSAVAAGCCLLLPLPTALLLCTLTYCPSVDPREGLLTSNL
jgi:hypothetical protein